MNEDEIDKEYKLTIEYDGKPITTLRELKEILERAILESE